MARLRYNGLSAVSAGALTSGQTTTTFAAALTHSGGVAVPTIVSPNYLPLSILAADGRLVEIVYLTAYTAGATTGTIARGKEGTTGGAHATGVTLVHAPSTLDIAGRSWEDAITDLAPVHRWRFNEASGTNVDDSVGTLDLTLSGTYARAAAGPFGAGGATTFTSAVADSSGLGSVPVLTADRSIVFLFRTTTFTRMVPVCYGTAAALQLFYCGLNDHGNGLENNAISCNTGGSYSGPDLMGIRPVAQSDGQWHLGVMTMSTTGKARSISLDGRIGSGVFVQSSTPAAGNFRVGKVVDNTFPFTGDISDVSVYNYALTAEQIIDLRRSFVASLA